MAYCTKYVAYGMLYKYAHSISSLSLIYTNQKLSHGPDLLL